MDAVGAEFRDGEPQDFPGDDDLGERTPARELPVPIRLLQGTQTVADHPHEGPETGNVGGRAAPRRPARRSDLLAFMHRR